MKDNESFFKIFKRIWRKYIAQHKGKIAFAVSCMLLSAIFNTVNAWIIQPVLDEIFINKNSDMLKIIPIAVLLIAVLKGVATYFQSITLGYLGQRIVSDMQIDLFSHIIKADLAVFGKEASGNIISRFTNDINMMRSSFTSLLIGATRDFVSVIGLVGVMLYQSLELSAISLFVFLFAILPIFKVGRKVRKISKQTQVELGNFTAQLDETFQGVRIVKAYAQEEHEVGKASSVIEKLFKLFVKTTYIRNSISPIMEALGGVAVGAIIWYGGFQVLEGTTTPGAFFSFMTAMLIAYKPLKNIASLNAKVQSSVAAAIRFFNVIDEEPTIKDAPNAKPIVIKNGNIEFKNVSFSYGENIPALRNTSMHIEAGKTVALVGHSGSGKSTLMNLILRFYDTCAGEIFIDGQEIKDITMKSLRKSISLVSQDIVLFNDTIKNNILYGKTDATEEDIIHAAKMADAHDFIVEFPDKYETQIGQRGFRLSGGQRQRISIARAMLKNAPILLMDEATSSLDPASEREVQKALDTLMQDRTTLVIAHRLSTVINAHKIFVLDKGEIVEADTHANLIKQGGTYSKLYEKYLEST